MAAGSPDDGRSALSRQVDVMLALGRLQGFLTHEDVTRLLSVVSDITPHQFECVFETLERERIELVDESEDGPEGDEFPA